jgi:hypothetical protein
MIVQMPKVLFMMIQMPKVLFMTVQMPKVLFRNNTFPFSFPVFFAALLPPRRLVHKAHEPIMPVMTYLFTPVKYYMSLKS